MRYTFYLQYIQPYVHTEISNLCYNDNNAQYAAFDTFYKWGEIHRKQINKWIS